MKVVISNKAYFKPDDELWDYCSKQTTYHIETMTSKYLLCIRIVVLLPKRLSGFLLRVWTY